MKNNTTLEFKAEKILLTLRMEKAAIVSVTKSLTGETNATIIKTNGEN